MPKCIIGPNGVAHGPMCKDGRLCGRRGNQLESARATGADPLVEEIWQLRCQNLVLRERLEQLEGERRRDADTLRKVIGK
jgi:hypothetical protein